MNQDEIIEMARQSGAMFDHMTWVERDLLPVFERFAKLVAAKEREACAKYVESFMIGETPLTVVMGEIGDAIRARGEA